MIEKKKRGFAAISPERLREIASAGGVARKKAFDESQARKRAGAAAMTSPRSAAAEPSRRAR